ncbi:MAG: hypothetical protein PHR61_04830 [Candidatus Absconditabacteria bacterium]|nr:hypothetical protein [Candidatus Absconditabacteria bacterium]
MLDIIKTKLLSFYNKTDKLGLFFSLFDANNNLLLSNGVLTTDKPLPELVEILYHALLEKVEKSTKVIAIDIVKDIQLQPDIQKLLTLSPKDYGIFMINRQTNISGVVLPDTQGITDIKGALGLLKQKYNLTGNVEISSFTTRRIAFQI